MDIGTILKKRYQKMMQDLTYQNSSTKTMAPKEITPTFYECSICKDREWIINDKDEAIPCTCKEVRQYKRILQSSGICDAFQKKTFNTFVENEKSEIIRAAKKAAMDYVMEFKNIKDKRENSIAFLGQVGCGKTHLSIAIANNLMKKNIGVLYMQYREVITNLKRNAMDEYYYQKEISKYKNATVLLIDDLYKGRITEADYNIMFEIINYRYMKNAPIIISSEYTGNKLLDFDEAIGSRIIEMCKGRMINFKGKNLNHRLVI